MLSVEQQTVVDTFCVRSRDTVVTACPGGGKTKLLEAATRRLVSDSSECHVLLLLYNRLLKEEVEAKLKDAGERVHVHTFHSFCSACLGPAPDDASLVAALERSEAGEADGVFTGGADSTAAVWLGRVRRVLVDEAQDMQPVFLRLLKHCLRHPVKWLVVGDVDQWLYGYNGATREPLLDPAKHFDFFGEPRRGPREPREPREPRDDWAHLRLTLSFRMCPAIASFLNEVSCTEIVGNEFVEGGETPEVLSMSPWDWETHVCAKVCRAVEAYGAENVAVLARSVRPTNVPLVSFVNRLGQRHGVPLYVHGVDGSAPCARTGRVRVCTWHSAKGLQFKAVVVLGVDDRAEREPLHVAMSRASHKLVVVQDSEAPHYRLTAACAKAREVGGVRTDRATLRLECDALGSGPPGSSSSSSSSARDNGGRGRRGPRNLEHVSLSLAAASTLCTSLVDVSTTANGESVERRIEAGYDQPSTLVATLYDGSSHDVTQAYVLAVAAEWEFSLTGRCARLEDAVSSLDGNLQLRKLERECKLAEGDRARYVDPRAAAGGGVLSAVSKRAVLRAWTDEKAWSAKKWLAASVAALSVGSYQHRTDALLQSLNVWASQRTFETLKHRLKRATLQSTQEHGRPSCDRVVLGYDGDGGLLWTRVWALVGTEAWTFVYEDAPLTRSKCIGAVVPLSLDRQLTKSHVLNLATGQRACYALEDPDGFRSVVASSS